jgi:hypothetical protein
VSRAGSRFLAYVDAGEHGRVAVGRWDTERDAALARDRAVLWFGLDRTLNLPRVSRTLGACPPERLREEALARADAQRSPSSRFIGVCWEPRYRKWSAYHRGQFIARFDLETFAAIARDRVALHVDGRRAQLNFPTRRNAPATVLQMRSWARETNRQRTTSRYRGVHRNRNAPPERPWGAQIAPVRSGRQRVLHLGFWPTELDAARAYDRAALFYLQTRAVLNFPEEAAHVKPAAAKQIAAEARRLFKETTTSRFRGVWRQDATWHVGVTAGGRAYRAGPFTDEIAAAREYDRLARRLFGKAAKVNFAREG